MDGINVFEKRTAFLKRSAIGACVVLPLGVAAAIVVGIVGNIVDDPLFISLFVFSVLFAAFALPVILMGAVMIPLFKYQLRTAQILLTDAEILEIKRPMELNLAIAGKAKKLLAAGKLKGDMTAFNEFRDLVNMTRSVGIGYTRYGPF